jgi:hypothetical protein
MPTRLFTNYHHIIMPTHLCTIFTAIAGVISAGAPTLLLLLLPRVLSDPFTNTITSSCAGTWM